MKANTRLTIEERTHVGGNFTDSQPDDWGFVRVEWFSIKPLTGREYMQAAQVQSEVTHQAESAWFAGASSSMRLRDATTERIFEVASVTNRDERNRKLDWMLTETAVING